MDKYIIVWRKIKRGIWKIPSVSHKYIVRNLISDCKNLLEKRIIKCKHNALDNNNMCAQILNPIQPGGGLYDPSMSKTHTTF